MAVLFSIDLPHTIGQALTMAVALSPWLLAIGVGVYVLTLRVTVLRVVLLIAVFLGGFWAGVVYLIGYSMARPRLHGAGGFDKLNQPGHKLNQPGHELNHHGDRLNQQGDRLKEPR